MDGRRHSLAGLVLSILLLSTPFALRAAPRHSSALCTAYGSTPAAGPAAQRFLRWALARAVYMRTLDYAGLPSKDPAAAYKNRRNLVEAGYHAAMAAAYEVYPSWEAQACDQLHQTKHYLTRPKDNWERRRAQAGSGGAYPGHRRRGQAAQARTESSRLGSGHADGLCAL